jgi:hypothetical protein
MRTEKPPNHFNSPALPVVLIADLAGSLQSWNSFAGLRVHWGKDFTPRILEFYMAARIFVFLSIVTIWSTPTFTAPVEPVQAESITVKVIGTLQTGIVAIGGETTGVAITAKGITWELDLGDNKEFLKALEELNGKKAIVEGRLEKRRGVEIPERWIVTVTDLKAAKITAR